MGPSDLSAKSISHEKEGRAGTNLNRRREILLRSSPPHRSLQPCAPRGEEDDDAVVPRREKVRTAAAA